jgi:hypothetical protein
MPNYVRTRISPPIPGTKRDDAMRKILQYTFIMLLPAVLLFRGCGEVEPTIYHGDIFISFTGDTVDHYTVMPSNAPYELEIGIPYPVDEDLEVGIEVVYTTAQEGIQFDVPSSVTIKKGDVTAQFYVFGQSDEMTDRRDTVVIGLVHEKVAVFNNEFTLYMQPPCDFVLEEFIGNYTVYEQSDFQDAPYEPYIVSFDANPNGGDTLIINGMWPGEPFKAVFHYDNPPNYTWNIPDQFLLEDLGGYGETRITDEGTGTVLTCEHTLSIRYSIYVSAGYFERASITFQKIPD